MLDSLLRHSGLEVWRKLGPKAARTLTGMRDTLTDQVVVSALKSNNDQAILELVTLFALDNETITRGFATLVKHGNVNVRDAIVAEFWDESPSQVIALLSRLVNDKEKAVQKSAARLILELSGIDPKSKNDSDKIQLYVRELDGLLVSRSREVLVAILEEILESGKAIPQGSVGNLLYAKKTAGPVRDLAIKVEALQRARK
jgi:hypothetical protein